MKLSAKERAERHLRLEAESTRYETQVTHGDLAELWTLIGVLQCTVAVQAQKIERLENRDKGVIAVGGKSVFDDRVLYGPGGRWAKTLDNRALAADHRPEPRGDE